MKQDISVYNTENSGFYFPKQEISCWIQEMDAIMKEYSKCPVTTAAGAAFHQEDMTGHFPKKATFIEFIERGDQSECKNALVRLQFTKKKGQDLQPLYERYEDIMEFHKDEISASILASSYYSMEELKMRLPKLEEILMNPYGAGMGIQVVTGTIMLADGGPAEGAKGIQMYFFLDREGVDVQDLRVRRMIGLLSVLAGQAVKLAQQISEEGRIWCEEAKKAGISRIPNLTEGFLIAGAHYVLSLAADRERQQNLNDMAFHLLTGMMDEVQTILDAVYIL